MTGKFWNDICVWKDMHQNRNNAPVSTTFEDSDNWDSSHPLYKCVLCEGLEDACKDYLPLNPVKRKYIRDERKRLGI